MKVFGALSEDRRYEIGGVLILALTTILFLALITDPFQTTSSFGTGRRPIADMGEVDNILGYPGAVVATFLLILLGHASHVVYFLTGVWGVMLLRHRPVDRLPIRVVGTFVTVASVGALLHLNLYSEADGSLPGGALGAWVGDLFAAAFGRVGANVLGVTLTLVGVLLATEFLFVHFFHALSVAVVLMCKGAYELGHRIQRLIAMYQAFMKARMEREPRAKKYRRRRKRADEEDDLSRIRVRDAKESNDAEVPFTAIPVAEEATQQDVKAPVAPVTTQADGNKAQMELPVEDKPAPVATLATEMASTAGKGADAKRRLPKRKIRYEEELPDDYEYPKKYTLPPLDIFEEAPDDDGPDMSGYLRQMSVLLEDTLKTFGIEAQVTDVTRGPTITRFELEPAPGIKVSRFNALADDLALALKAHRVRVEAPIPGKGRVGIEVPNARREAVVLRELLESRNFRRSKGRLELALGKDIAGDAKTADLATMPHVLVAGATGAGKTVCVKALLASLLCSKTPEELQLMLIDPKMVELSIFNDIPHLMTPVVIDPKKAAASLNWLILEMEERYRLFAHLRVRNIEVYNESVENGEIEMGDGEEGEEAQSVNVIRKLPYIVCVIDELADLMMLARSEVEDAIGRLAQLARAVGIHLIIATQRPSVDVLTGVIKANFPARISFQVSSRVDSRCILDEIGAERLIGNGDMLYLPAGQSKPLRIQGAFVSDDEMNQLIAYLKTQAPPQYRDEIENYGKAKGVDAALDDEVDELFEDAVQVVLETGQASISMVQRRLRVGYTRAARLIDMMEVKGIVGPHVGSKAREILVGAPPKDEVA